MFEKVVDLAYELEDDPRIAVEVLLGHGICHIIAETDISLPQYEVEAAVERIAGKVAVDYMEVPQDSHLAKNQEQGFRCGDNGIFRGEPVTEEQQKLAKIAREIYDKYGCDGKYILDDDRLIICQSNASKEELCTLYPDAEINPLGDWTGGTDVDTGATNRKLGSDMGDSVTGGGLHGKDLSKADVSVNIWAHACILTRSVASRSSLSGALYADAYETKGTVQAPRLCRTGPFRTKVLRTTQGDASRRGTVCCEQRLWQCLAESKKNLPPDTPAVRGVHEGR